MPCLSLARSAHQTCETGKSDRQVRSTIAFGRLGVETTPAGVTQTLKPRIIMSHKTLKDMSTKRKEPPCSEAHLARRCAVAQ